MLNGNGLFLPRLVNPLMTSLRHLLHKENSSTVQTNGRLHSIDINVRPPTKIDRTQCGTLVEFIVNGKDSYDIFQVYKDGDTYRRIDTGLELLNINGRTPKNDRSIPMSFTLDEDESEMDLYFCVIPSSKRESVWSASSCPKIYCEKNRVTIEKRIKRFSLTDKNQDQVVYLHQGDTIELTWPSKYGHDYHIEEKKHCVKSGGLYTPKQTCHEHGIVHGTEEGSYCPICRSVWIREKSCDVQSPEGTYTKEFTEFGTSYLCRFANRHRLHDITACIVNGKHHIRHIKITDRTVPRELILIEQNDWVLFEWNIKGKLNIVQMESFHVYQNQQKPIKVCIRRAIK